MQRSLCAVRTPSALVRPASRATLKRQPVVVPVRATAATDGDDRLDFAAAAVNILSREWAVAPTWSVGISAHPTGRDSPRRSTVARSAASEKGVDATAALHGEWPLLSNSLASYDNVAQYYRNKKSGRRN